MDITPSRDAESFNRIANHPEVLPHIAQKGQDSLDFEAFFHEPGNYGLLGNGCAFVFHRLEPGVYEVHSMALPEARGRNVLLSALAAVRYMFIATPCMEVLTRVVVGNVPADALTKAVGFTLEFERPRSWSAPDGKKDCRFYALRYNDWLRRQQWLNASGEWFHDLLGEDKTHDDDHAHDMYVGACVEMVRSGQAQKGIILYNRWARFAGYEPVEIVTDEPLIIDIKSHLLRVDGGEMEVISCQ